VTFVIINGNQANDFYNCLLFVNVHKSIHITPWKWWCDRL